MLWRILLLSFALVYSLPASGNELRRYENHSGINDILKEVKEMQRQIRSLNDTITDAMRCEEPKHPCLVPSTAEEDEINIIRRLVPHDLPYISKSDVKVTNAIENKEVSAVKTETALIQPSVIARQRGWERTPAREMLIFWHYGGSIIFHMIYEDGYYSQMKLGNPLKDCDSQITLNLPKDIWFKMEIDQQFGEKILATLVKAPEFDGRRVTVSKEAMMLRFPQHADIIHKLPG